MSHLSHVEEPPLLAREAPAPSLAPFWFIWAGQAGSLLGSQLVQFALVWWLTQTTGSATVLALATLMALLPQILLSPLAGVLVDRWNRRWVMMAADGVIALATGLLAVLFVLGAAQIWHVYALMFIRALGAAFHWPAMQASTTLMVPQRHLARIAGLNDGLQGTVNIIAPPLGALLLGLLPLPGVLGIDIVTALLAISPLFFIPIPQPARSIPAPKTALLADLRQGVSFLWAWPGLLLLVGIIGLVHLVAIPAFSLLPILVTTHFNGGALQLAWLESAFGLGMVTGGLTLGAWGGFKRRVVTAAAGLVLLALGLLAVGLVPTTVFLPAVLALFVVGLALPFITGSIRAILQVGVPPELQGRIFTLVMSGSAAMSPLGLGLAGPLADLVGPRPWYLVTGLVILVVGIAVHFIPAVMRLEDKASELTQ